jgi:alpha-ketoglutarate-dependent taurine dioxygenase
MTYYLDPPGLQIFTMVQPAKNNGGASVFGDGLAAAYRLRRTNVRAYHTLCTTFRRFRCIDPQTGWHLEASAPMIQLHESDYLPRSSLSKTVDYNFLQSARVVGIRHNDLDRMPDLPPPGWEDDVASFYENLEEAHYEWDRILADDSSRLEISLRPGETVIVNNQRCFHGRCSFEVNPGDPDRMISGCYVSADEFKSRLRREGFNVW